MNTDETLKINMLVREIQKHIKNISDTEQIHAVISENCNDVFTELYQMIYDKRIKKFIKDFIRLYINKEDEDDIFQECNGRLYNLIKVYNEHGGSKFKTLFYTAVKNHCCSIARTYKTKRKKFEFGVKYIDEIGDIEQGIDVGSQPLIDAETKKFALNLIKRAFSILNTIRSAVEGILTYHCKAILTDAFHYANYKNNEMLNFLRGECLEKVSGYIENAYQEITETNIKFMEKLDERIQKEEISEDIFNPELQWVKNVKESLKRPVIAKEKKELFSEFDSY